MGLVVKQHSRMQGHFFFEVERGMQQFLVRFRNFKKNYGGLPNLDLTPRESSCDGV